MIDTIALKVSNSLDFQVRSITNTFMKCFIDFINNNKYIQSNILYNASQIFEDEFYRYQLDTLDGGSLPISTLLSEDFDLKLIDTLDKNFIKSLTKLFVPPEIEQKEEKLVSLPVYAYAIKRNKKIISGGDTSWLTQTILFILIIFAIRFFMFNSADLNKIASRPSVSIPLAPVLDIKLQAVSIGDERRSVYKILTTTLPNITLCILKISGNKEMFESYEHESKVYTRWNEIKSDASRNDIVHNVAQYYGGGYIDVNKPSYKTLKTKIKFTPPGESKEKEYDVELDNDTELLNHYNAGQKQFYYLTNEYNNIFKSMDNVLFSKIKTWGEEKVKSSIHKIYGAITILLGEYNQRFGFYHGDLHTGNILINEEFNKCRFFDFDFSGFLPCDGQPAIISKSYLLYAESYYMRVDKKDINKKWNDWEKNLKTILSDCNVYSKNFVFLFDCLRLLIASLLHIDNETELLYIMNDLYIKSSKGLSTRGKFTGLMFTPYELYRKLIEVLEEGFLVKLKPEQKLIRNLLERRGFMYNYFTKVLNFSDADIPNKDWFNKFIMSPDIVEKLYDKLI